MIVEVIEVEIVEDGVQEYKAGERYVALWCEELEEFVELADGVEIEIDEKKLNVVNAKTALKTVYTREKGSENVD